MSFLRPTMALVLCFAQLASACAQQQPSRPAFEQRLQDLYATFRKMPEQWHGVLSTPQIDVLEDTFLSLEDVSADELATMANVLLFAEACTPEQRREMVAFACDGNGEQLRWPMVLVAIHHRRYDDAARLIVTACLPLPAQQRPYRVWKWWQHLMMPRPDYYEATRDLSLALLRHFETAHKAERDTIRDILGKLQMTEKDLPALRKMTLESFARQSGEWELSVAAEERNQPARIWIEDRHGLRAMDRAAFRSLRRLSWRQEVRLQSGWGKYSPTEWGMWQASPTASLLARAVTLAGDETGHFAMPHGVVMVRNRCTDSERLHNVTEIGNDTKAMLESYLLVVGAQAEDGTFLVGKRKGDLDRLMLASVRVGAAESSRLLAEAGPLAEGEDVDHEPATAVIGAVTGHFAEVMLDPAERSAWFDISHANGKTFLEWQHGDLTIVAFERASQDEDYRRVGVTMVSRAQLAGAVITAPAPMASPASFVVEMRPKLALRHYQGNLQSVDKKFAMDRDDVRSLSLSCPDAETQHALAVKLRALTK